MKEQRRYMRKNSEAQVEISHPSLGVVEFKAKDLSDGGVFVFLGNHIALPVGTLVQVRIKRHTGFINEQAVDMQVVHHQNGGMGLMFV